MNGKNFYPYKYHCNFIVQNQGLIIEIQNREIISTGLNANQVTYQSSIIIHQIKNSNIFKNKYHFKIFMNKNWKNLIKILWKITQIY